MLHRVERERQFRERAFAEYCATGRYGRRPREDKRAIEIRKRKAETGPPEDSELLLENSELPEEPLSRESIAEEFSVSRSDVCEDFAHAVRYSGCRDRAWTSSQCSREEQRQSGVGSVQE